MKQTLDIFLALIALLFLLPIFFLIAIMIKIKLGSPILFIQLRAGFKGKNFEILKFRTMKNEYNNKGELLPDNKRITKFGKFLRTTSLDELPGLLNVLKGDMSLVGPRPLLVQYVPLYSPEQARRHEVKPGITGWAQVNGRNSISWDEKFELDVWYVDNRSMWLDLKILWLTLKKVIVRDGINTESDNTMPVFKGSKK